MSQPMLIVLRVVHIAGGVFWVGTVVFFALFLEPSVREAGADGAKVMQALMRRKYMVVIPLVAVLTMLAGVGLLEEASGGFHPEWMSSRTGMALSLGATLAIVAFVIGIVFVRPAALRLAGLMPQVMQSPDGPARDALMGEAQTLRGRLRLGGRIVAALLAGATIAMAVARYLQ